MSSRTYRGLDIGPGFTGVHSCWERSPRFDLLDPVPWVQDVWEIIYIKVFQVTVVRCVHTNANVKKWKIVKKQNITTARLSTYPIMCINWNSVTTQPWSPCLLVKNSYIFQLVIKHCFRTKTTYYTSLYSSWYFYDECIIHETEGNL